MKKIFMGKKTEQEDRVPEDSSGEKIGSRLGSFLRGRSKTWRMAMTTLAVVVVFITTYGLVLPAITIEKDAAKKMPGIHLASDSSHEEEERTSGGHLGVKPGETDKNDSDGGKAVEYLSEPLVYHGMNYDISLSIEEEDHIPEGTILLADILHHSSQDYISCKNNLIPTTEKLVSEMEPAFLHKNVKIITKTDVLT